MELFPIPLWGPSTEPERGVGELVVCGGLVHDPTLLDRSSPPEAS